MLQQYDKTEYDWDIKPFFSFSWFHKLDDPRDVINPNLLIESFDDNEVLIYGHQKQLIKKLITTET